MNSSVEGEKIARKNHINLTEFFPANSSYISANFKYNKIKKEKTEIKINLKYK